METMAFNNTVIGVPAETILDYLKWRNCRRYVEEQGYSEGMVEAQDMYASHIMIWATNEPKLGTVALPDLVPELERIALELIG